MKKMQFKDNLLTYYHVNTSLFIRMIANENKKIDSRFFPQNQFGRSYSARPLILFENTTGQRIILQKERNLPVVSRLALSQSCHTKMLNDHFLLNINKT